MIFCPKCGGLMISEDDLESMIESLEKEMYPK